LLERPTLGVRAGAVATPRLDAHAGTAVPSSRPST
jgi:hypothetical protein